VKKQIIIMCFLYLIIMIPSFTSCRTAESNERNVQEDMYGNYYEIYVGSFYDSDGDGMGDIRGIIEKLDYINDGKPGSDKSLHVDGLWLMPIMPSPSYHKYDVTDYYNIDPEYGTMEDFEALIDECGKRGVKVIIDLVMNHTSIMHPWFLETVKEIKEGKEPYYQNFYNVAVEKKNSEYYFMGVSDHYYEGVFYSGMPDLNFDNEAVRDEFRRIADFWLDKGVAGFRLDAIKHIYASRAKSVDMIGWFIDYCKSVKPDIYIVGEVWSDDAEVMDFYKSGIPSLFNFGFAQESGYIARAVNTNTGADFASNVVRWYKLISSRNADAIDAPFISNHDNDRSAGYFKEDVAKEKMAAALLLFMPGNAFIYYGEEIGLTGKGIDENKRGPMIWSLDDMTGMAKGPSGMTQRAKPSAGVDTQLEDKDSLLRFYIEAIRLRNKYPEISRGVPSAVKLSDISDRSLAAYRVTWNDKEVIVLHNLSDEEKTVKISDVTVKKLGGMLSAGGGTAKVTKDGVYMPAYSTVVIQL